MNYAMRTRIVKTILLAMCAASPHALFAQAAPSDSAPASTSASPAGETVVLSPFQVNAERDVGFVAASALAGGRLSTDLRDTPVAYSVLTRDFIDALNLTSLTNAQQWSTGFNAIEDDGRQNQFGSGEAGRRTFRGVTGNQQQIEFFQVYYDYDSYNLERFDFARGPNSILFGSGGMGGTANALYKRARTDKPFATVQAGVGSWNNYRATLDVNQPVGENFALRFNAMVDDSDTWRDMEYFDKMGATLALTYRPWRGGELRATGDIGEYHRNASLTTLGDQVSGWNGNPFTGTGAGAAGAANGINTYGANTYTLSPSFGAGVVYNLAGQGQTMGGNNSGAVPVGGRLVVGSSANYATHPILNQIFWPDNAYDIATSKSSFFIPGREFTTTHQGDTWNSNFHNILLSFDQQVGDHVFLGVSGSDARGLNRTDYTIVRGLNNVFIDINQTLPGGGQNPNYLKPYSESPRDYDEVERTGRNYRASAAFVFDGTRWGNFRVNLEAGDSHFTSSRAKYRLQVKDPAVLPRNWITGVVRYRYYWGQSQAFDPKIGTFDFGTMNFTDPVGGNRSMPVGMLLDSGRPGETIITTDDYQYYQAAFNAQLFNQKLNLLVAVRRDDFASKTDQMILRGDIPDNWNGWDIIFRPRPPEDYYSLPTTRPRVGNSTNNPPMPGFENQRYQDDYSIPTSEGAINTVSYGAVYHVTKIISVFGNFAETWVPPTKDLRIDFSRFDPVTSEGWDAGIRLSLLDDRISVSASRYETKQENLAVGTGTGTGGLSTSLPNAFNAIANANKQGNLSPDGRNERGMELVPSVYSDTAARRGEGYEFEIVANVTPAWRIMGNLAFQDAVQGAGYADTRAYMEKNDALMQGIVDDAGATIAGGAAGYKPGANSTNAPDALAAANAYLQLKSAYVNLTPQDQKVARLAEVVGNLFTDYTVQTGPLKNFRFGAGVNYRGREVIGYRGGDTIVDPANPASAIDNPAYDATSPYYRKDYYLVTGVLGYDFKVKNYPVRLTLTINNLLDEDMPLYYNTVQRPPNGNVGDPSRVATADQYSYIVPRSFNLTATVTF
jgi:outer membrane receptor protein involved in Fe transport